VETKAKIGVGGRSLPDAIGQVLDMYLREKADTPPGMEDKRSECGDSMPFGQAAVVNAEGCTGNVRRECHAYGFGECKSAMRRDKYIRK
jgi:hypothetical protein